MNPPWSHQPDAKPKSGNDCPREMHRRGEHLSLPTPSETSDSNSSRRRKQLLVAALPLFSQDTGRRVKYVRLLLPLQALHQPAHTAQWSGRPSAQGRRRFFESVTQISSNQARQEESTALRLGCPSIHSSAHDCSARRLGQLASTAHKGGLGCEVSIMDAAPPPRGGCFSRATAVAVFCYCPQESKAAYSQHAEIQLYLKASSITCTKSPNKLHLALARL